MGDWLEDDRREYYAYRCAIGKGYFRVQYLSGWRLLIRSPRRFLAHFKLMRRNCRSFWSALRLALI